MVVLRRYVYTGPGEVSLLVTDPPGTPVTPCSIRKGEERRKKKEKFYIYLDVTHTHHLSHKTLSHALFHTQLSHTPSFTHNFVTHTIFPCHAPSFTYNFVTHNFVLLLDPPPRPPRDPGDPLLEIKLTKTKL